MTTHQSKMYRLDTVEEAAEVMKSCGSGVSKFTVLYLETIRLAAWEALNDYKPDLEKQEGGE